MPIRDSKLDPIAGYAAGALVGEVGQLKNGELSIDTDVKAVAAIAAALSVFRAQSDVEIPAADIPEPPGLPLLAAGLGAMFAGMRRE